MTVEENILKKANQKRLMSDVAIEGGNFTTAFFKQQTIKELFAEPSGLKEFAEKDEKEKKSKQRKEKDKSKEDLDSSLSQEQMEKVMIKYWQSRKSNITLIHPTKDMGSIGLF